ERTDPTDAFFVRILTSPRATPDMLGESIHPDALAVARGAFLMEVASGAGAEVPPLHRKFGLGKTDAVHRAPLALRALRIGVPEGVAAASTGSARRLVTARSPQRCSGDLPLGADFARAAILEAHAARRLRRRRRVRHAMRARRLQLERSGQADDGP